MDTEGGEVTAFPIAPGFGDDAEEEGIRPPDNDEVKPKTPNGWRKGKQ